MQSSYTCTFLQSQFKQIKIINGKLMIELRRHNKTAINNRICPLCKNGVVRMNIILLFYAPASTISGVKCLPIYS